jgi:8-oxo-dGTP pyrophosphatase MutT (NUDIX family)
MMFLESLVFLLSQRLRLPLPGAKAHEFLRARPSGPFIPNFTHKFPPKPGSVLILLYEENGILKFPLIKRPEYLGAHSGQISLPGGKAEEGETTIETALREGEEEIGIDRREVQVLGTLSTLFVVPSNFMVTPIIAHATCAPRFKADEREVAGILHASLSDLVKPNAIQEKEIVAAGKFTMLAPHFELENEIVWGATAMMLNEFRTILHEVKIY